MSASLLSVAAAIESVWCQQSVNVLLLYYDQLSRQYLLKLTAVLTIKVAVSNANIAPVTNISMLKMIKSYNVRFQHKVFGETPQYPDSLLFKKLTSFVGRNDITI